jgi:hypothetical protein
VNTQTGSVTPSRVQDPQTFTVSPWFLANVDYELMPEFTLGLGYYNFTNQLAPDGTRRNPLWSPDARVFFDITANLDEIYTTLAGSKQTKETNKASASTARKSARMNTFSNSLLNF